MIPRLSFGTAALLLAACASAPEARPAPPEMVALRFAPQPGSARIESEEVRTLRVGEREQVRRTRMSATASVLQVPEGYAFVNEDVTFESDTPNPMHELAAKIAEGYRVVASPEGEIVALHGLEELQSEMLQWFDSQDFSKAPPQLVEQLRHTVAQLTDPNVLAESSATEWFVQVAAWNGKTLEIGRTYEAEPPATYTYRALERVPCTPAETAPRCVRLELAAQPSERDRTKAREALTPLLQAVDPNAEMGPIEVEDRVELVVVPETLDAYRMVKRERMRTTVSAAGESARVERDEVRTTTWRYE